MKRFLLFAVVVALFTACTQEIMVDVTNPTIADDAPETLVVGFEGDDTRIQLQGGKTVWTQGDQVSVFYKSDANQKWQYNGETGSRTAELKRVDAGVASARMDRVVVAYPYSDNYLLNLTTGDIEATMPAVQTYMKDSYGLDGNIMVASSYFTQFNLKNVCGWLKLQLTGDGEVVKSIKLRGNNGEQVAGLIYVDTENATSILASEMGDVTEDEGENITGGAGGNLVFDDTILTEVTLNCGEGVTLGKSATAFYIALPPQTFTQGLTVEITDDSGYTMTQATDKVVAIERNTIQPMAAIDFVNPNTPAQPTPANNQIWYTAKIKAEPNYTDKYAFGANVISNALDSETGKGIITFDGNVTMVGYQAFYNCDNFITINLPDSVTTIGESAFYSCDSLTSVTIGDSVTTIGNYAFQNCT
ncbi:MAG: leucine-rich repeat domain-containing protein, partial [Alistipes sp.]|nr:leucine-rich repeat domain-containing protein [Alistipes sp.]